LPKTIKPSSLEDDEGLNQYFVVWYQTPMRRGLVVYKPYYKGEKPIITINRKKEVTPTFVVWHRLRSY